MHIHTERKKYIKTKIYDKHYKFIKVGNQH